MSDGYIRCGVTFQYRLDDTVWMVCDRPRGHDGDHFGTVRSGVMPGVRVCSAHADVADMLRDYSRASGIEFPCGCAVVTWTLCRGCSKPLVGVAWRCPVWNELRCGDCAGPHEVECCGWRHQVKVTSW